MSRAITKGAVDQTIYVEILDSTSTTGGRKTGLAFNTASLTGYYVRNGGSATAITLATLAAANSAHSDGGFKEVDATNMPGIYRLDLPDAAVASGADSVVVTLKGATGMVQVSAEVQLTAINTQDAVRLGLTALPNAAADAAGGLPISDAGGLDLDAKLANTNEVTAARMGALTDWIDGGRLDLILDARSSQTSVDDVPTNAELATALAAADDAVLAAIAAGVTVTTNNDKTGYTLSATGSAAMTEGYAALGAAGTLPQILYEIRALLAEKSIATTTLTTKKLDGATTAATYTLDDATTPSAITRAT